MNILRRLLTSINSNLISPRTTRQRRIRLGTLSLFVTYYISKYFFPRPINPLKISSVPWSNFLSDVSKKDVVHAVVDGQSVRYLTKSGGKQHVKVALKLSLPGDLMSTLQSNGAIVSAATPSRSFLQLFITVLPLIYIGAMAGVLYKFYNDSIGDVGGQAAKRHVDSDDNSKQSHSFDMVSIQSDAVSKCSCNYR